MFSLFEILVKIVTVGFVSLLVAVNIISPNKTIIYQKEPLQMSATTTLATLLATSTSSIPEINSIDKIKKATTSPAKISKINLGGQATTSKTNNPIKETLSPIQEKLTLSIKPVEDVPKATPSVNEVNELGRHAAVNILCYTQGGSIRPLTGSGVIIDERGVILTNAHIAQYFLLKDFPIKDNIDCIIRMGSPATPAYRGELLYISPPWVEENKKNIIEESPLGTGENDFGLILITSMVDKNTTLPATLPYVSFNTDELDSKESLLDYYVVVAYPAGFLGGITVIQNLYISSAVSTIKQFFTFKEGTIDLMSLGGSALAQKGSSGGSVIRVSDKKLVGIIVTTTSEENTGARDLRAITLSHINRSIGAVTNQTLSEYLSGDLVKKVLDFRLSKFDYLKSLLVSQINTSN